jgi:hypothetical protein
MQRIAVWGISLSLAALVGLSACASTEAPAEADAPEATLDDAIDERDEGTSYNGWTQTADVRLNLFVNAYIMTHTFTRSSGDATRGGGGCFVIRKPGTSCSSDATCTTAAQAQYGASAYGYCYSGVCYSRPGGQSPYCALAPNRSPGVVNALWGADPYAPWTNNEFVVGCMTKTAGPNPACGGTNTSLYMRTMAQAWLE